MEQYAFIVPVIVVIWVMILGIRVGAYLDAKAKKSSPEIIIIPEKFCPPHRWKWEEQPGMENTCFMRCQRCRRLPGWERET
jgi:hypothetical protein